MKSRLPVVAAVGVVLIWGALLGANFGVLDLSKEYKIQTPLITFLWFQVSGMLNGAAIPLAVLVAAFLLACRQILGWVMAIVLCVTADFVGLALAMPFVAKTAPSLLSNPLIWMLGVALLLNQVLLVALVYRRPDFAR